MKRIVDGNKACADVAYLFTEIAAIYPITPSSPMASEVDDLKTSKKNIFNEDVEVVEMQSEAGASGTMHGALLSGSLSTTFTASQGLLLMIPNMYKIAGEGLPGVIHVASRTVATHALSIFGDHSDIYSVRGTGWAMLASSNVQEAQDLALVAHLSAIKGSVPFLHFFDGFRTSHEINTIETLPDEELIKLVDQEALNNFKKNALTVSNPHQNGLNENEDIYFQSVEARNKDYLKIPNIVNDYMTKVNAIMKTSYAPFNYYGSDKATSIIIAMGSVCDTIKELISFENKQGHDYGLIEVHLYRPFSKEYLRKVLPKTVNKIAVLDRCKEAGSIGEPLYLDVLSALKDESINIVGGRYGLSSKNTTPSDILGVYKMLEERPMNDFTIGIVDDLTNLSIPPVDTDYSLNAQEILIYGFGSDGMISASKDMMHLIGDNMDKYVQGYFEYDSKKSGGVTVSHLRISTEKINAPYYVTNPSLLVITKDTYLDNFDMFNNLKKESTVVINSAKNPKDLLDLIPIETKELINKLSLKVLFIDADKIAENNNIKGKISKIMEIVILKLLNIKDSEELVIQGIEKQFKNKGQDVINANIKAIKEAITNVKILKLPLPLDGHKTIEAQNIFEVINKRKGNDLKTSDVLAFKNGDFPSNLASKEKRKIATSVPIWHKENCIQCGLCSIVCPHAVIRPFIVKDEERGIPLVGHMEYNYEVLISEDDCLACGLCVDICPGKKGNKALSFGKPKGKDKEYIDDMFNNYHNPQILDKKTIKGSQLERPCFAFSGACAGCGETPYIKLLTQVVGPKLVVANATGCSSIYGGTVPSTPYSIAWANSLFEDNAEFGYGMYLTYNKMHERVKNIMQQSFDAVDKETKKLYNMYLADSNNYERTKEIKDKLAEKVIPEDLRKILDYVPASSLWIIGGDGWAYDIGFGGIDHVLSTESNVKILILDTEVYSNTGGQASKASHIGQVSEFANIGKKTIKKDLFKICMNYPNCYVANISLGSNFMQAIKVLNEAEEHDGPSVVIAYSPCIEHGIKGGMVNASKEQALAVKCGYTTLMHYNPLEDKLYIDSPEPDFHLYQNFLMNEVRYRSLINKDPNVAKELLAQNIKEAQKRYNYYKKLSSK